MKDFVFNHGDTVSCKITGFTGTITGRSDFITGCNTYSVQPSVDEKGGWVDAKWFDEYALELVAVNEIDLQELTKASVGG